MEMHPKLSDGACFGCSWCSMLQHEFHVALTVLCCAVLCMHMQADWSSA
jgi:hypothetical protein